jgi:hypothetical protein
MKLLQLELWLPPPPPLLQRSLLPWPPLLQRSLQLPLLLQLLQIEM